MGHMLKNTVFQGASHTLGIPANPSSIGPGLNEEVNGQIRFNTSTNRLEFWANITGTPKWNTVAREGNVAIVAQSNLVGTGSRILFEPMSYSYSSGQEAQVIVFVGTVYQIPVTNYTFAGNSSIQFSSAPSGGSSITILHNFASTFAA